jgi:hypothetical protein
MAMYSGWGHFGFHWITPFHNIAGMLTESATTRLATPIYIHPDQLRGETRGLPEYEAQTTFPNPWPGGWWRLRDIVERQKVSAWALLDLAARNRETVLWNAYLKARRQTGRGAAGRPAVYVIPRAQHDPLTAIKLVNKLLLQGIEVQETTAAFTTKSGMTYAAGAWAVSAAQPKLGVIRYLLGRTSYPDNEWTRSRDGAPQRPYDMATDTMFEFMGVRVDPLDEAITAGVRRLAGPVPPPGSVDEGAGPFTLDGRLNDSFRAVNLLLGKGVAVRRAANGDFVVAGADREALAAAARETGVRFTARRDSSPAHEVKRLRVAMYQRYRGGNMDEGWTRLLLEQFGFPYTTVRDAEIKKGGLVERFDVVILPDDSSSAITGERPAAGDRRGRSEEEVPPEYRSGIGKDGVAALVEFVKKGGTLVALGGASNFAIESLELPLRNVTANRNTKEFWCPGSTLHVVNDPAHPLAWGMPGEGLALYVGGSPAFEINPGPRSERIQVVMRYADRNLLESGWLIGEQTLTKKAAVAEVRSGQGRAILYGIRVQHRAQTHGTFKLLFNALLR